MDNNPNDNHGEGNTTPPAGNGGTTGTPGGKKSMNIFAKIIAYCIAVPAVLINEGTRSLFRKTYTGPINAIVGVLLALGVGIGTGYHFGWTADAATWKWVTFGVSSAVATFLYVWPLLYLSVFKFAFNASEKLWSHVNIDARSGYYSRSENERKNPAWFSKFLMFASYALLTVGGLILAWNVAGVIAASQATWGWVGTTLGVISVIVFAIVSIAIFFGIASLFRSGGFAFFLFLVACVVSFFMWGTVSAMYLWAYHGLTAKPWVGFWGYVAGMLPGLLVGGGAACILGAILHAARLRAIAVVTGVAATYYLSATTTAFVSSIPLGMFEIAAPALNYLALGLEVVLFVGFVFPLVHIFVTHALRKLADIFELFKEAYRDETPYRGFFMQVTNLAVTYGVAFHAVPFAIAAAGFALPAWAVIALSVVGGFASYTLGGKLLNVTGPWPTGLFASAAAAVFAYGFFTAGSFTAWAVAAVTLVGTFFVLYPLAYLLVRFLTQGWLGAWLGEPLVNAHKRACSLIGDLFEQLFHCTELTYGDESKSAETFLHLFNLAALGGVAYGGWILFTGVLGFATWLAIFTLVILGTLSYLLVGKLLQKTGNSSVGVVAGLAGAIYVGAWAYASQPWGWVVAVIVGLVAAALTFAFVFPIFYLVLKAILNVVQQESWLNPALVNVHNRAWERFTSVWADFMKAYREVRDSMKGIRESVRKTYEEVAANVRQILGRKNDDNSNR